MMAGLDLPVMAFKALFLSLLLAVAVIDLRTFLIPNRLLLAGLALGLPLLLWSRVHPLAYAVAGMAVVGGIMLLVALLARGGMGAGDVKLAGVMGFFLGPGPGLVALFVGFLCGAVLGLLAMLLWGKGRKDYVPFGPALAAGGVVALFWGQRIWEYYSFYAGLTR